MDLNRCPECAELGHDTCYEAGRRAGRDAAVGAIEARIAELERQGPSLLLTAYRLAADLARADQPRAIQRAERRGTDG